MNQAPETLDDEIAWRSVLNRDQDSDGKFVYAVRSTGVYCRPSCPSRRPGRNMVAFFRLPEAAKQAGYRPCRRCRPESGSPRPEVQKVHSARQFIDANLGEPLTLRSIGEAVGLSPFHLQRMFKRVVGVTPRQYQKTGRLNRFKTHVRKGKNVTEALYDAGYGSSSRLYEHGSDELGMTPSSYRKEGRGVKIRVTIADTTLGYLLIAATDRGVCKVAFGNKKTELEADLRNEFGAAEIRHDDDITLTKYSEAILAHLEGRKPALNLPIDVRGTAFQRKVWEALRRIPYGQSRSYGEIAEAVGSPGAVRAVGTACANNPVALVVPCHRVVPKAGGTGGYRWGVDRKRKLLEAEAKDRGAAGTSNRATQVKRGR
jgi:AraC family transcriptional regulator of adaptative response/methylated-DNA-[protein]-cysteine methyltransferase